jgi:hypothetical protein
MKRSKELMTYHGRKGHPLIHKAKTGKSFIMVRKRGGGVKKLFLKHGRVPAKYKKPIKHRK